MLFVKKNNLIFVCLVLLFFLQFGCKTATQETSPSVSLEIDYFVRYIASNQQFKAAISFAEIDSTKKIVPKRMKEVLFQKKALDGKKSNNSYRYQITQNDTFSVNQIFQYTIADQKMMHEVVMNPIEGFEVKKQKISKKAGTKINLQGNPLTEQESLVVLITDANDKTTTITIKTLENSSIDISGALIENLTLGKGSIYLVRKQIFTEENSQKKLNGRTEFYSKIKTIEIIE